VSKGISRIPLPLARLTDEDLIKLEEMIEKKTVVVRKESSGESDELTEA
jgi:hypothetical protein